MEKIQHLWKQIYEGVCEFSTPTLERFMTDLADIKNTHFSKVQPPDTTWYKDAVIYSTYADLFNKDFSGLTQKLDHLKSLGVNCIWLLPVLESPMKDAGFDISNYEKIRSDLLGCAADASTDEKDLIFADFIKAAHDRHIRVIFDIALNHCSVDHAWFKEARKSIHSTKRDYFIWSDTTEKYKEARIIFKGMCTSNWEKDEISGEYYFHRFFEIQPDLNYRNPEVLVAMTKILINWKIKGIDGFRADAVPYLWKEEDTNCENLEKTHLIVKFLRAVFDYLEPGTLLLAEACQPPKDVVAYFGTEDECHAAYHFPVMPRIYRAMAEEKKDAIEWVMHPDFTPAIPPACQWFMFLRCHDELTLEMVTPEERAQVHQYYAKDPSWDFREGEGISARLASLLDSDIRRIRLAYSIMFTLLGTPIIYYGDEFAKTNDKAFYEEMYAETGYKDSRYLVRGRIDWIQAEEDLKNPNSLAYQVYTCIQKLVHVRKEHKVFGRGTLTMLDVHNIDKTINAHVLSYTRQIEEEQVTLLHNLSAKEQVITLTNESSAKYDLLDQPILYRENALVLPPYGFYWL